MSTTTPHDTTPGTPCDYELIKKEETPFAQRLAEWIKTFDPAEVLDIGAGPGIYVDAIAEKGMKVRGLEIDDRAFPHPLLSKADFTKDVPPVLDGKRTLAISIEVGEHIAPEDADKYVDYLTKTNAKNLIFTAALPGQGGHGHVNCQPKSYWIEKITARGYVVDQVMTDRLVRFCRQGYHMGWFVNNAIFFRRHDMPLTKKAWSTSLPRLHMIGLFHTVPNLAYSHCAFTGKVLRFSKMMQRFGWQVTEYANGTSESTANEKVRILSESRLDYLKKIWIEARDQVSKYPEQLTGDPFHYAVVDKAKELIGKGFMPASDAVFHGDTAAIGSPHWAVFNASLIEALKARVQPGDIICHPFGRAHSDLVKLFPQQRHVETGIGYPDHPFGAHRIFETYVWQAWHQGRDNRNGNDYEFVVPNYFDLDEWPVDAREKNDGYLLYFGRVCEAKGMEIIQSLAKEIDEDIIIVGQGDLGRFAHPRLKKLPAVSGLERAKLLQGARALLMPTRFTEPFGGAGVEGMLVGTPLIASDFGAFSETVHHGKTGFRCHTLGDWIEATKRVGEMDRSFVSKRARALYSLEACGARYDKIFRIISDLDEYGWQEKESRLFPGQF